MTNKVCIILQGYAVDKVQLRKLYDYYHSLNFKIVISTYSEFCPDDLKDKQFVVLNDESLKQKDIFQPNGIVSTANYQLNTVQKGIELANKIYPECKYYLKLRADMCLDDLDKYIPEWEKRASAKSAGPIFDGKILCWAWQKKRRWKYTGGPPEYDPKKAIYVEAAPISVWHSSAPKTKEDTEIYEMPWYVFDYWAFAQKQDLEKYYSIPFVQGQPPKQIKSRSHHPDRKDKEIAWGVAYDDKIVSEQYISQTRILIDDPSLSWDEAREIYFTFDKSINCYSFSKKIYLNHKARTRRKDSVELTINIDWGDELLQ